MKDPMKPRDKITQKMSRDGLTEQNQTTGESELISKRIQDADFQKTPEQQAAQDAAQLQGAVSPSSPLPHAPEHFSKPQDAAAERVMEHIGAGQTRKASKKAVRRAQEAAASKAQPSRLQFTDEERATPELEKYIKKSDKAADRLDAARAALPPKKKSRLQFDKQETPPSFEGKRNPLSRPAQEAGIFVHNKIHSVEKDNAGVEGAHKAEELGERGARYGARKIRQGYHSRKLKPYREAVKAEKAAAKANINVQYRKALRDNPRLASNPVSRLWQKRQIKKQYVQAWRKKHGRIRKTAENTRRAAQKAAEKTRNTVLFVARHPVGVAIAIGVLLLFIMIFAGLSSCASIFSGGASTVVGTSYVAEDAEMIGAEQDYAALEADLQQELDTIEETYPGYDEYRYDLDTIGHDPYVLTSILTAMHLDYTRAGVQETLQMLFEKQYILTITEEVETLYRTETRTGTRTVIDPETGKETTETYEYEVQVPYDERRILNVSLENFDLSHLPVYIMDEETLSLYATYMQTLGGRPDLFPTSSYPNASTIKEPTYYEVPPEALEDATFAAMLTEAEKYLGYPYVWGGSSPSTSFDCSGFVSWVINHSGWDVGRLGAQGLYNICTPVAAAQAKPGDLIFFQGTYDVSGVSHVGLYVGGGMMIHCGDPISYANVNTEYWQNHFYAYGRLP